MSSLVIRPSSIADIPSIVRIRRDTFTEQEVSGFIVPGESPYTSSEKLRKMWAERTC